MLRFDGAFFLGRGGRRRKDRLRQLKVMFRCPPPGVGD
jgi:hypothetical protein